MVINLILVFAFSFFSMNLINAIKSWHLSKQYNYFFRGIIDNVRLEGEKIFFKIKWSMPPELNNVQNTKHVIEYYEHYVESIPTRFDTTKKQELFAKIAQKYMDKPFNLQAKIENNKVVDIKPFAGNIQNVLFNTILVVTVLSIFIYKNNIPSHF